MPEPETTPATQTEQTVPYSRFKEVNDLNKIYKDLGDPSYIQERLKKAEEYETQAELARLSAEEQARIKEAATAGLDKEQIQKAMRLAYQDIDKIGEVNKIAGMERELNQMRLDRASDQLWREVDKAGINVPIAERGAFEAGLVSVMTPEERQALFMGKDPMVAASVFRGVIDKTRTETPFMKYAVNYKPPATPTPTPPAPPVRTPPSGPQQPGPKETPMTLAELNRQVREDVRGLGLKTSSST